MNRRISYRKLQPSAVVLTVKLLDLNNDILKCQLCIAGYLNSNGHNFRHIAPEVEYVMIKAQKVIKKRKIHQR